MFRGKIKIFLSIVIEPLARVPIYNYMIRRAVIVFLNIEYIYCALLELGIRENSKFLWPFEDL